jgi:prepilin-type processing-associated H-X9-DG protein
MKSSRVLVGVVLGVILLLSCIGMLFPIEFVFTLAFGWIFYLARVAPEVTVNPAGVATLVVCLVGVSVGSHLFLTWLHGAIAGPDARPWRPRWTAQLVAGFVLMFIAGMAAAGVVHQTGWLLTSPEPWVNPGGMQAAYRAQSVNNMKQIGLGVYSYHAAEDVLPPGATMGDHGTLLHSWQTLILPYIEQGKLYEQIHLSLPWDDPANAAPLREVIPVYLIASRRPDPKHDASGRALSYYEGNAKVVGRTKGLKLADVTDGASNTILAGEIAGNFRPWGEPGHWRDPADGINAAPDRGFGSPFPGGANVLMLDGSVKFLKNTINPAVLRALSTPAGSETIPVESY